MNDPRNLTILLLVISAAVLGGILLSTMGEPAYAEAMSASRGDYVMATGQVGKYGDLLYMIDRRAKRLNVYSFDPQTDAMTPQASVDLGQVFRNPN